MRCAQSIRFLFCLLLCLSLLCLSPLGLTPAGAVDNAIVPEAASGLNEQHTGSAPHFLVATANDHATRAAVAMLEKGGSAVDAAIAAQLVLGLVEPQSSGIGGGAFLLYWDDANRRLHAFDGRETAPMAVDDSYFLTSGGQPEGFLDAVIGGHSVGTPGVVRLLALTHRRFGKRPWSELFAPAIQLAEQGFAISPRLATLIRRAPRLAVNPQINGYFFNADGSPKTAGTLLRNPAYASTLRAIAKGGDKAFYEGPIAAAIVATVRENPSRAGKLALTDLKRYRAIERDPLCSIFREYAVCGMPPPSSGGTTVLAILGLLERFPAAQLAPGSTDFYHLFSEASRLAFADRDTYLADPDFVAVPTHGLIHPDYLAQRSQLLDPGQAMRAVGPGQPQWPAKAAAIPYRHAQSPERVSTSHIGIVDSDGNVVAMTTSIEGAFGSRLMVGGFLLNNQLTDFSFVPKGSNGNWVANRIEPGKRPRSSMAPTIVFRAGEPVLLTGSPGGARIIDYVARTLMYTLNSGMPIDQAVASPHVVNVGQMLELERGRFDEAQKQALRARGHQPVEIDQTSGLNVIEIGVDGLVNGSAESGSVEKLRGANDPRREGTVRGG